MNLLTEKLRFSAGLVGVFVTVWLTLFCHHCLAAAGMPGDAAVQPASVTASISLPQGPAPTDCNGDCLNVHSLTADKRAEPGQSFVPTVFKPTPTPAVSAVYRRDASGINLHPGSLHSPERSLRHPLTLTTIQLK